MLQPPQGETVAELRYRHILLLAEPHPLFTLELKEIRLLTHITSIQVELVRFHTHDKQAMLLYEQLATLTTEPLSEYELLRQLLTLLHSAG